jgi:DNA invertase Pin-like site-specific DNA recombinase
LAELKGVGVQLRSVMEMIDETPSGKLMRNIHGAFNQFDNDRKAERTKLGMKRAASMGRFSLQGASRLPEYAGKDQRESDSGP